MNYECFCFAWTDKGLEIVNKEYFKYYTDALKFQRQNTDPNGMYDTVSITPLNEYAETVMREYDN